MATRLTDVVTIEAGVGPTRLNHGCGSDIRPGHVNLDVAAMLEFEPCLALGSCSLKETAAILERCALTIYADSGLMHVSAAVGTPALAIYGPTDYRRTSPTRYDNRHRVVRKEVKCGPCFKMEGDAVVRVCSHRKCLGLVQSDELVETAEEMRRTQQSRSGVRSRQVPHVEREPRQGDPIAAKP